MLALGFRCEDGKRRNKIARIIAKNGFRDPAKLRFAPRVEKWIGAENIRPSEVEELKRFCTGTSDVCKNREMRVAAVSQASTPELFRQPGARFMAPCLSQSSLDGASWEVLKERWALEGAV